jgi:hypothetical protein
MHLAPICHLGRFVLVQPTKSPGTNGVLEEPNRKTKREYQRQLHAATVTAALRWRGRCWHKRCRAFLVATGVSNPVANARTGGPSQTASRAGSRSESAAAGRSGARIAKRRGVSRPWHEDHDCERSAILKRRLRDHLCCTALELGCRPPRDRAAYEGLHNGNRESLLSTTIPAGGV